MTYGDGRVCRGCGSRAIKFWTGHERIRRNRVVLLGWCSQRCARRCLDGRGRLLPARVLAEHQAKKGVRA